MRALLGELGDPQVRFRAVHVVGTNGKSSTTRLTAALLEHARLATGSYISPHVADWSERIQLGGRDADFERLVAAVRPAAEQIGATQFEALTAAALNAFAEAEVDVAVVEAGLGGRLDATNVLDAPVVVLTNVSLDHTEVLGETRELIAREKLAVVRPGATVVLGEEEWEPLARELGAANVVVVAPDEARANRAVALAAAEAFLGRRLEGPEGGTRDDEVALPGRAEWRLSGEGRPAELREGAHNPAGAAFVARRLREAAWADDAERTVIVLSVMRDKDAEAMLQELAPLAATAIVTTASNPRALPADELAAIARRHFRTVEADGDPATALARARQLAGPSGRVLVTGSLYLLADLHSVP